MRQYIYEHLHEVKVIDTHEHLWDESYRLQHPGDWTAIFKHYAVDSLCAVGMNKEEANLLYAEETFHDQKWEVFSKYFDLAKNTTYIQAALLAVKDIYGIDRINSDSMEELTAKIRNSIKPGFYRRVLGEMAGIDYWMVNCFDKDENGIRYPLRYWGDTELMRPDLWVDPLIYPCGRALIEKETGVDTSTFNGWLEAVDVFLKNTQGIAAQSNQGWLLSGILILILQFLLKLLKDTMQKALEYHIILTITQK